MFWGLGIWEPDESTLNLFGVPVSERSMKSLIYLRH